MARKVIGLVYMSSMDTIIYANALVTEADHLISQDSHLIKMTNRIKTNGELPFPEVRRQLAIYCLGNHDFHISEGHEGTIEKFLTDDGTYEEIYQSQSFPIE